jgi:hypothetical protein
MVGVLPGVCRRHRKSVFDGDGVSLVERDNYVLILVGYFEVYDDGDVAGFALDLIFMIANKFLVYQDVAKRHVLRNDTAQTTPRIARPASG